MENTRPHMPKYHISPSRIAGTVIVLILVIGAIWWAKPHFQSAHKPKPTNTVTIINPSESPAPTKSVVVTPTGSPSQMTSTALNQVDFSPSKKKPTESNAIATSDKQTTTHASSGEARAIVSPNHYAIAGPGYAIARSGSNSASAFSGWPF